MDFNKKRRQTMLISFRAQTDTHTDQQLLRCEQSLLSPYLLILLYLFLPKLPWSFPFFMFTFSSKQPMTSLVRSPNAVLCTPKQQPPPACEMPLTVVLAPSWRGVSPVPWGWRSPRITLRIQSRGSYLWPGHQDAPVHHWDLILLHVCDKPFTM